MKASSAACQHDLNLFFGSVPDKDLHRQAGCRNDVLTSRVNAILRIKQVQACIGMSRSSIYAKLDRGGKYYDPTFPRPFKLGAAAIGWYSNAIFQWLEGRSQRIDANAVIADDRN